MKAAQRNGILQGSSWSNSQKKNNSWEKGYINPLVPKDSLPPVHNKSVHRLRCECRDAYIGLMGRNIQCWIQEHYLGVWRIQTDRGNITMIYNLVRFLAKHIHYSPRVIKEFLDKLKRVHTISKKKVITNVQPKLEYCASNPSDSLHVCTFKCWLWPFLVITQLFTEITLSSLLSSAIAIQWYYR